MSKMAHKALRHRWSTMGPAGCGELCVDVLPSAMHETGSLCCVSEVYPEVHEQHREEHFCRHVICVILSDSCRSHSRLRGTYGPASELAVMRLIGTPFFLACHPLVAQVSSRTQACVRELGGVWDNCAAIRRALQVSAELWTDILHGNASEAWRASVHAVHWTWFCCEADLVVLRSGPARRIVMVSVLGVAKPMCRRWVAAQRRAVV